MAMNTTSVLTNSRTGRQDNDQKGDAGYSLIAELPAGLIHIREAIGVLVATGNQTFDWSASPIQAVELKISVDTHTTPANSIWGSLEICINPQNDTIRDNWLTDASSLTLDSNRIVVPIGPGGGNIKLAFTSNIEYIGFSLLDGVAGLSVRVNALGVEG